MGHAPRDQTGLKYFTAEELKGSQRPYAHAVLEKFADKEVRRSFSIAAFNAHHDAAFPERARTRILDLGVGSGGFAEQLRDEGYRIVCGVDVDDYLKPETKPFLREFRTVDLSWERLPWPEHSFDIVTAWCTLPHLENPFFAVREACRVLLPGGLFIFQVPHLSSRAARDFFSRKADFQSYKTKNNHVVVFTRNIISKAILRYFDLVNIAYDVRPKVFDGPVGFLRQIAYRASGIRPLWRHWLEERWAYSAAYVVRKKN